MRTEGNMMAGRQRDYWKHSIGVEYSLHLGVEVNCLKHGVLLGVLVAECD